MLEEKVATSIELGCLLVCVCVCVCCFINMQPSCCTQGKTYVLYEIQKYRILCHVWLPFGHGAGREEGKIKKS